MSKNRFREFKPFKVTITIGSNGMYYDPNEPPHLDAIIDWCLRPCKIEKDEDVFEKGIMPKQIGLPLKVATIKGLRVFHASAFFPEGKSFESITHIRKRFRRGFENLFEGNPNTKSGQYREYDMPYPKLHTHKLVAYGFGNVYSIQRLLRENINFIGKKRSIGFGQVITIDVSEIDTDYSFVKDGKAMRFLPDENGTRQCRIQPPYWHDFNRVNTCEIGDKYEL